MANDRSIRPIRSMRNGISLLNTPSVSYVVSDRVTEILTDKRVTMAGDIRVVTSNG